MENFKIPFPLTEKVLDNNLRVTVLHRQGFRKLTALLAFPFGSLHKNYQDQEGREYSIPDGTAHFLEHQMFKQEDGSNVSEEFAKFGAYDNAFTGHDQTVYLAESSENQEEVLKLLLNYTDKPFFQKASVDNEKEIIIQELLMYKDQPEETLDQNLRHGLFGDHQASQDIGGTPETVNLVDAQLLYDCYDAFYNPAEARLVVVGDIEPEIVFQLAANWGSYPRKGLRPIQPKGAVQPPEFNNYDVEATVARPLLSLGYADYFEQPQEGREFLKRRLVTNMLLDVLFSRSSEFYWQLLKDEFFGSRFRAGYFATPYFAYAGILADSLKTDELIKEINQYLHSPQTKTLIQKEDLNRIKKKTLGELLTTFENSEDTALNFLIAGYYGYEFKDITQITMEITPQDLAQRFEELFLLKEPIISVIRPTEE